MKTYTRPPLLFTRRPTTYLGIQKLIPLGDDVELDSIHVSVQRHTTHQKDDQDDVGERGGEVHHLKIHTRRCRHTAQSPLSVEKGHSKNKAAQRTGTARTRQPKRAQQQQGSPKKGHSKNKATQRKGTARTRQPLERAHKNNLRQTEERVQQGQGSPKKGHSKNRAAQRKGTARTRQPKERVQQGQGRPKKGHSKNRAAQRTGTARIRQPKEK